MTVWATGPRSREKTTRYDGSVLKRRNWPRRNCKRAAPSQRYDRSTVIRSISTTSVPPKVRC